MRFLAISGSLRSGSANTGLLRAMAGLAPEGVELRLFQGLGALPHYAPGLDGAEPLAPVKAFRAELAAADAVIVCTPEYAHGMPGVLKNGLDWVVSSGEFVDKPTAALSASPSVEGGIHAHAWLAQTLGVMSARLVEGASLQVPFVRNKLGPDDTIRDPELEAQLRAAMEALEQAVAARPAL